MESRRDVFQAIADPTRRAILLLLTSTAMTPGAIADNFETSRQTISKHIQILTECNLLTQNQQGREIYYHFNPITMKEVYDWLSPFKKIWEDKFTQLDEILENLK